MLRSTPTLKHACSTPCPLLFSCGEGNFGKIWSTREQHEI